jgi:hypothetical protein
MLAYAWAFVMLFMIVASSVIFVLETLPKLCCGRYDSIFNPVEAVFVVSFTVEYLVRLVACPWYYPRMDRDTEDGDKLSSSAGRRAARIEAHHLSSFSCTHIHSRPLPTLSRPLPRCRNMDDPAPFARPLRAKDCCGEHPAGDGA